MIVKKTIIQNSDLDYKEISLSDAKKFFKKLGIEFQISTINGTHIFHFDGKIILKVSEGSIVHISPRLKGYHIYEPT